MSPLPVNKLKVVALCVVLALLNTAVAAEHHGGQVNAVVTAKRYVGQLGLGVIPGRYDIDVRIDPDKLRFDGIVRSAIDVREQTKVITLNAVGLSIDSVILSVQAAGKKITPADITLNPKAETAAFTFADSLVPGPYELVIHYHGSIDTGGSGVYAHDSGTPAGKTRVVKTFFEPADFRKFVPSWDEPDMKAVFALSVTAPAQQMVVSNTPPQAREQLPGGWQKVTFSPTPRMSTYLVFVGVGDWERVTRQVDGIEVGLVVPRGTTSRTGFALEAASELLKYYNSYFGVKYPLAKLDFISSLGRAGGVENWGAISMGANALLLDPATSGSAEKQEAFTLIAHEMAHQWFGDLVTMRWWDEIWLNEGFATWMEYAAIEELRPQWQPWLKFSADEEWEYSLDGALAMDGRGSSHPIVDPSVDTASATHADPITYQKSAAVIRMMAAFLGPEAFRAGIRRYMQEYQFGNPNTKDFLTALERASGKPVIQMGEEYLMHAGVPLLEITESARGGVALRQERFAADADARASREWHVPVRARSTDGRVSRQVVVCRSTPQIFDDLRLPLVVNADRLAYARTQYSAPAFKSLLTVFARLPAADQLTLLSDNWALATANYAPLDNLLSLIAAVPDGANPLVWSKAARSATRIAQFLPPGKQREAFLVFARGRLSPQLQRLGWDPEAGESDNAARLRTQLIEALSELDDPQVLAESRRLFAAAGAEAAKLASEKGQAALQVVAAHADAATFAKLEQMAQRAADPMTQVRYYQMLATAKDPALSARVLEWAAQSLQGKPAPLSGSSAVSGVARSNPDLAWQFATAHHEALLASLESIVRPMFFPYIVQGSLRAQRSAELGSFAAQYLPPEGRSYVAKARAQIEESARLASRFAPQVESWLHRAALQNIDQKGGTQ